MIERIRAALIGERVHRAEDELPVDSLPEGVVFRRGRLIPWIGGRLSRMAGPAAAVTLGRTVIIRPDVRATPELIAHELAHVRQWEKDPLFPVRYSLATLRHGYRNNPYEVEAREVEASAARTQSRKEANEWRDPS